MSKLDWRRASPSKPKLSVKDEAEYRNNDAAARWLEGHWPHKKFAASKTSKWKQRGKPMPIKSASVISETGE